MTKTSLFWKVGSSSSQPGPVTNLKDIKRNGSNNDADEDDDINDNANTSSTISSLFWNCLIPRPTAWITTAVPGVVTYDHDNDGDRSFQVSLIQGYNGAADHPPTIMLASKSIPPEVLKSLLLNRYCALSVATVEQKESVMKASAQHPMDTHGGLYTFDELKLESAPVPSSLVDFDHAHEEEAEEEKQAMQNKSLPKQWQRRPQRQRPPAVSSSPIHMHCQLTGCFSLSSRTTRSEHDDFSKEENLLLLSDDESTKQMRTMVLEHNNHCHHNEQDDYMLMIEINHYFISRRVLVELKKGTSIGGDRISNLKFRDNIDVRRVLAKIDARLINPVVSLGFNATTTSSNNNGYGEVSPSPSFTPRFGQLRNNDIYHMYRPILASYLRNNKFDDDDDEKKQGSEDDTYHVDSFRQVPKPYDSNTELSLYHDDVEFNYMRDVTCKLGYNPFKQIIMPRPIGWISTYSKYDRLPHIAPYSFFIDVSRNLTSQSLCVAFIACRKDSEAQKGGIESYKDAHRDAILTGDFAWNLVSEQHAWEMNYSAAPLDSKESEFQKSSLQYENSKSFYSDSCIDAPIVKHSPLVMECKYIKTVVVPKRFGPPKERDWFCIIGKVVAIRMQHHQPSNISEKDSRNNSQHVKSFVNVDEIGPVARLGYLQEYGVIADCKW